ncbi:uncharacterized protein [Euphorbia lathyris]|uniref:uncharacterized protein n=1 Tax=Euphorbia lathyris TaxID=212925 RepID=UPI0033133730
MIKKFAFFCKAAKDMVQIGKEASNEGSISNEARLSYLQLEISSHGQGAMDVVDLIQGAHNAVSFASKRRSGMTQTQATSTKHWKPPPADYYKLNCDAAHPLTGGCSAAGFIVRDNLGKVLMSGGCPLGFCWSPLQAELLSILNGLIFSSECGF